MRNARKAAYIVGSPFLASVIVGGCIAGDALELAEEPLEGLPPYGRIAPEEAITVIAALQGDPEFVLLDIRTPAEVEAGHLPGAVGLDFRSPTSENELGQGDRKLIYLIYCRTANRSGQALGVMREMGFAKVYNMQGGITLWKQLGYPICKGAIGEEHVCVGEYRRRHAAVE